MELISKVTVRLSVQDRVRLEDEAMKARLTLSQYLRKLLGVK